MDVVLQGERLRGHADPAHKMIASPRAGGPLFPVITVPSPPFPLFPFHQV